jgi:hypothetical protein
MQTTRMGVDRAPGWMRVKNRASWRWEWDLRDWLSQCAVQL